MNQKRYSMAFTTGAVFHRESVIIAELYCRLEDWSKVRDTTISKNLLQTRTVRTSKKVCNEVISRLKTMKKNELEILINGTEQERSCMLWLALCRRYVFIGEFAIEVIHEHFLNFKHIVDYDDFNAFFSSKAQWHPELESIADSTLKKLRQVLFKMLRAVGILMKDNMINSIVLSQKVYKIIVDTNRDELLFFPVSVNTIAGYSE